MIQRKYEIKLMCVCVCACMCAHCLIGIGKKFQLQSVDFHYNSVSEATSRSQVAHAHIILRNFMVTQNSSRLIFSCLLNSTLLWLTDSLRSAILLANFKNHILRRITQSSQTLWANLIN